MILGQVQDLQGKNSLMLESWVKLLVRIREGIEIVDHARLVGFVITVV